MSPLMRITGALFVSAALGGCASMKEPVKPEFVSSPDGCGVMNKNTGQLISMSIECLAQKQLEAEKQAAALQRKAELEAMANLTSTIIKQPVSKDNPQAQNMGVVLGILKNGRSVEASIPFSFDLEKDRAKSLSLLHELSGSASATLFR